MIEMDDILTVVEPKDLGCEKVVPVVFDSPHSGIHFPDSFQHSAPDQKILWNCDMHLEKLLADIPQYGATLLYAKFLRCFIDLHRSLDDIDDSLLSAPWPEPISPSDKTKLGRGLIRKYADKDLPIYNRRLSVEEVQNRIKKYYQPYHDTLKQILDERTEVFGGVWHLNMHSMPPFGRALFEDPGAVRPDIAMANKDGNTSSNEFFELAADTFRDLGYEVWMNKPYKGQILITAYSDPEKNRHSIQIELNRKWYMDWDKTLEPNEGFQTFKSDLNHFAKAICAFAGG